MSSYDQPGFVSPIPGNPDFNAHCDAFTAPGSTPPAQPDTASGTYPPSTSVTMATVTPPGASTLNADRVPVGPLDVLTGAQALIYDDHPDLLTGVTGLGVTGAGQGHVVGNSYPGSRA